jgi:hypothetical protein
VRAVVVCGLSVVVACTPEPASIVFLGGVPSLVTTADPRPLPEVEVRDRDGRRIEPQPKVEVSIAPVAVATVDRGKWVALGNGDATMVARVGEVRATAQIRVRVVDRVELECARPSCNVQVDEPLTMRARLWSRGATVAAPSAVQWTVTPAGSVRMDTPGQLATIAPGASVVEARVGPAVARREVIVAGPLDSLRVLCPTAFLLRPTGTPQAVCTLRRGVTVPLDLEASGGGQPIADTGADWHSSAEHVVGVEAGRVFAQSPGRAEVTASVGALRSAPLVIEVIDACVGPWFAHELSSFDVVYCRGRDASVCLQRIVRARNLSQEALDSCCCTRTIPDSALDIPFADPLRR